MPTVHPIPVYPTSVPDSNFCPAPAPSSPAPITASVATYKESFCIAVDRSGRNPGMAIHQRASGWGFAAADPYTAPATLGYGPVILDRTSEFFIGARKNSNNQGELSAMAEALLYLTEHAGDPKSRESATVFILYDSKWAYDQIHGLSSSKSPNLLVDTCSNLVKLAPGP